MQKNLDFKKRGIILSPKIREDRIGETNVNTYNHKMTIIKYNGKDDVIVKFDDKYEIKTSYSRFKSGEVENPYDKSLYGTGYLGEGVYYCDNINKIYKRQYNTWQSMLQRCYDKKYQLTRPTYIGCSVCEEWLNFQNFAQWYDENYYEIEGQRMELDKDILVKGNKLYSPETCVIVPNRINSLFIKSNAKRGNYPIGVSYDKRNNKYMSSGKNIYLGYHSTIMKAFETYKNYKENLIKQLADKFKDNIPQKLHKAMYEYQVEITD